MRLWLRLSRANRVAQLAASASCVRSTRNLRVTFNCNGDLNPAIDAYSVFLVAAPPTFCEGGLPNILLSDVRQQSLSLPPMEVSSHDVEALRKTLAAGSR